MANQVGADIMPGHADSGSSSDALSVLPTEILGMVFNNASRPGHQSYNESFRC